MKRFIVFGARRSELLQKIDQLFADGFEINCVTSLLLYPDSNDDPVNDWLIIYKKAR